MKNPILVYFALPRRVGARPRLFLGPVTTILMSLLKTPFTLHEKSEITMNRTLFFCVASLWLSMHATIGWAEQPPAKSYYLIGNSLTWDTLPGSLDGDVAWHVDCGVSLPHIFAHPEKPCVESSTLWPTALKEKQYDVISMQPHYGSTLEQDIETIGRWMAMQPKAVFVIHSGWAHHAQRETQFAKFDYTGPMSHSPAYYRELVARLRQLHPTRELRQTRAINLLEQLSQDIAAKQAPFAAIVDLYRDDIHMKPESGKYLMHNAMRHALGQPRSSAGFEKMDANVKQYLDGLLDRLSLVDADEALLEQVLSPTENTDRSALIAKLSSEDLKTKLTALLPQIEEAAALRRQTISLQADLKAIDGKLYFASRGPQWLYLAAGDRATELFETPVAIDLYNGNNPLKGRGGKNEAVTEDWLKRIAEFSTIQKLDLSNCPIQDAWLAHVGTMAGLQELSLTLTPVTDAGLAHLHALTELRTLGLASSQCNGTGFAHLTALKKLENVNFHFTPLNDAGLCAISKVGISDRLWFAHTHFTDKGAACLANLTNLRRCGIGSQEADSSGNAVAALAKLQLSELYLLDKQATPEGIVQAAKIDSLRLLEVAYGPTVDDASVKLIAEMPHLEEFRIGSAQITDDGLQALAASKSLKKVVLSQLKSISEAGVNRLRMAKPELTIVVE